MKTNLATKEDFEEPTQAVAELGAIAGNEWKLVGTPTPYIEPGAIANRNEMKLADEAPQVSTRLWTKTAARLVTFIKQPFLSAPQKEFNRLVYRLENEAPSIAATSDAEWIKRARQDHRTAIAEAIAAKIAEVNRQREAAMAANKAPAGPQESNANPEQTAVTTALQEYNALLETEQKAVQAAQQGGSTVDKAYFAEKSATFTRSWYSRINREVDEAALAAWKQDPTMDATAYWKVLADRNELMVAKLNKGRWFPAEQQRQLNEWNELIRRAQSQKPAAKKKPGKIAKLLASLDAAENASMLLETAGCLNSWDKKASLALIETVTDMLRRKPVLRDNAKIRTQFRALALNPSKADAVRMAAAKEWSALLGGRKGLDIEREIRELVDLAQNNSRTGSDEAMDVDIKNNDMIKHADILGVELKVADPTQWVRKEAIEGLGKIAATGSELNMRMISDQLFAIARTDASRNARREALEKKIALHKTSPLPADMKDFLALARDGQDPVVRVLALRGTIAALHTLAQAGTKKELLQEYMQKIGKLALQQGENTLHYRSLIEEVFSFCTQTGLPMPGFDIRFPELNPSQGPGANANLPPDQYWHVNKKEDAGFMIFTPEGSQAPLVFLKSPNLRTSSYQMKSTPNVIFRPSCDLARVNGILEEFMYQLHQDAAEVNPHNAAYVDKQRARVIKILARELCEAAGLMTPEIGTKKPSRLNADLRVITMNNLMSEARREPSAERVHALITLLGQDKMKGARHLYSRSIAKMARTILNSPTAGEEAHAIYAAILDYRTQTGIDLPGFSAIKPHVDRADAPISATWRIVPNTRHGSLNWCYKPIFHDKWGFVLADTPAGLKVWCQKPVLDGDKEIKWSNRYQCRDVTDLFKDLASLAPADLDLKVAKAHRRITTSFLSAMIDSVTEAYAKNLKNPRTMKSAEKTLLALREVVYASSVCQYARFVPAFDKSLKAHGLIFDDQRQAFRPIDDRPATPKTRKTKDNVVRFVKKRKPKAAVAISADISSFTVVASEVGRWTTAPAEPANANDELLTRNSPPADATVTANNPAANDQDRPASKTGVTGWAGVAREIFKQGFRSLGGALRPGDDGQPTAPHLVMA